MTTFEDRFWAKVDKNGPMHEGLGSQCWRWTAARTGNGYGAIQRNRKPVPAHRIAWELTRGPIPPGDWYGTTCVRHRCDNGPLPCVNPDHLELGSHRDNMRDVVARGRQRDQNGSKNCMAKINEDDVRSIRARYAAKTANAFGLAREYGMTVLNVRSIIKRRSWKHVE